MARTSRTKESEVELRRAERTLNTAAGLSSNLSGQIGNPFKSAILNASLRDLIGFPAPKRRKGKVKRGGGGGGF